MFELHGNYSLDVLDDVLLIHAFDNWNLELSLRFRQQLFRVIDARLQGKRWGCVVVLHNWFPAFECIEILAKNNQEALAKGMVCEGFVPCDEASSRLLTSMILPPDTESFHRRRFVDERSALAWAHKFVQDLEQELTSH